MKFIPTITEPVYPPEDTPRHGKGYAWTARELQVIRERYLSEGLAACRALLPVRCANAIMMQAARMGLRRQAPHAKPRQSNEMLDAAIKRLYSGGYKLGELKAFCARWRVTRQWVFWRAKALGVVESKSTYNRPWSPEEDAIIESHAHKHPTSIAKHLQKAGFDRKPAAVQGRRSRLQLDLTDPEHFSAHTLAVCMGLDEHRVLDFIRRHGLKAKKTGDGQRDAWLIRRKDVREWLIASAEWDHKRCNREWLIEMLAGRVGVPADAREDAA
jgi:hypothetical protein